MKQISDELYKMGVIPVVKITDANRASKLAKALLNGGINCIEVTFRSSTAAESIRHIKKDYPEMLVGAGTVISIDQVDQAVEAGAEFIVTPGFNEKVTRKCLDMNITIFPGCNNPSDIEKALDLGLTNLKFFPAEACGGLKMIKALSGPFPTVRFIPTGGINMDNLEEYLSNEKIIACGGTWIANNDMISKGNFEEIEETARKTVDKMLGFKLAHVGINCDTPEDALQVAKKYCELLNLPLHTLSGSVFAGDAVEAMNLPFLGKNGHIAFTVNYLDRAYAYLERKGYQFNEATLKYFDNGKKKNVYLKDEIGGFAIHIMQK